MALAVQRGRIALGVWRLADPKISLASFASLFLGTCAATAAGPLSWGWLALTVLGIFAIEVAKNASGELFDFDADTGVAVEDRSPFSGGKRVLVDGLLTREQVRLIALIGYLLGAGTGLAIVLTREASILWVGMLGMACAYFYNASPVRLSYRGLGEAAVALCYGPLIAAGAFLVQRGTLSVEVVAASVPLGLLIGAFLWINEFPDYRADIAAAKRNLVVRMGRRAASRVFAGILGAAFVGMLLLPLAGAPWTVCLGVLGLPSAAWAARLAWRHPEETERLVPAQAATLSAFVLYALGAGIGLVV